MRSTRNSLLLAAVAVTLGACAQNPDPALRPNSGDFFARATDALTPAAPTIKDSGVRLSNHATEVQRGAYVDWCPMYRIGCPAPYAPRRRPTRRLY